ncbi:MAG: DUF3857 and transglutaminase domain-containing protein [Bacteroidales bacterium]|nr:DUF3857 and transglutaminase domain-containing protein [Bacteroidales bacterium]
MKKLSLVFLPVILLVLQGQCQQMNYRAIPEHLTENANAIVRYHNMHFEISSTDQAELTINGAVSILNENDREAAFVMKSYDEFSKIKTFKADVYDHNGNKMDKLRGKDILDRSIVPDHSMYTDNRLQFILPKYPRYPYTVEYEIEIKYHGSLFYPDFTPYDAGARYNVSAANIDWKITSPVSLKPRYKVINLDQQKPNVINNDGEITMHWHMDEIKAFDNEPFDLPLSARTPQILIAPNKFEMDNYAGNMKTWKDMGHWVALLNKGRDKLPPEEVSKIKQLTDTLTNRYQKIKAVYEYLQSRCRYVSIQFGIGGWQTMPATEVCENGYGDCKGLVNYTQALLGAVGIDSYYTLVKAGKWEQDIYTDFPSVQFNHVLLSVPHENDTIWLECTDMNQPFGYLGRFTIDRHALMITPGGGKLVKTPKLPPELNLQSCTGEIDMNASGDVNSLVVTQFDGLQYDLREKQLSRDSEEKHKWISQHLDISGFTIRDLEYQTENSAVPSIHEEIDLHVKKYATKTGDRLFFKPNMIHRVPTVKRVENRESQLFITWGYHDTDTLEYRLPKEFEVEHLPEPSHFKSPYGSYDASVEVKDDRLVYARSFKTFKGTYEPQAYHKFRNFRMKVNKADNAMVILKKK